MPIPGPLRSPSLTVRCFSGGEQTARCRLRRVPGDDVLLGCCLPWRLLRPPTPRARLGVRVAVFCSTHFLLFRVPHPPSTMVLMLLVQQLLLGLIALTVLMFREDCRDRRWSPCDGGALRGRCHRGRCRCRPEQQPQCACLCSFVPHRHGTDRWKHLEGPWKRWWQQVAVRPS